MTLFSHRAPSFDLPALLELFDGDRDAIADLLEAAMASIRTSAQTLENASDSAAIVDATHRLKGTGATIGATGLLEISARIETAALASAAPLAPALLTALRGSVDSLEADICRTCHHRESDGV